MTEEAPKVMIFAGPNGSGKTSLTRPYRDQHKIIGEYINADDIAQKLVEAGRPRAEAEVEAFDEAERRRQACLSDRRSFTFETVFSHHSKVEFIREAKKRGYHVTLNFVTTENPAVNIARVEKRVREGGHFVAADKIVSRYYRAMANLPAASLLVDEAALFDNSSHELRLVATLRARPDGPPVFTFFEPIPRWILGFTDAVVVLLKGA